MRFILLALSLISLMSCGGSGASVSGPQATLTGFESINIDGTNAQFNTKKGSAGEMAEEGVTRNGVKDGVWMTYHDDGGIKTITSYVNGIKNGISLEFSKRGQIDKRSGFLNDQLHGLQGEYKFGRVTKEVNYNNAVLDGPFTEYNDRGKMQKRGAFKNGKQHGKLEFFDDEENLVMEYIYDNGTKVSGGIIEKKEAAEQK